MSKKYYPWCFLCEPNVQFSNHEQLLHNMKAKHQSRIRFGGDLADIHISTDLSTDQEKGKWSDGDYVYTLISVPPREVRYSRGAGAYGYRLRELEENQQKLLI